METKSTQQEILLNTNTHFAHQQWADKDAIGSENLGPLEQLEKACWEGMVKELIPELDITLHTRTKLWLWQVHTHKVSWRWIFMNFRDRKITLLPLILIFLWENLRAIS